MKYHVQLDASPALEVELPPLRAGATTTAVANGRELPVTLLEDGDGIASVVIAGRNCPLRPLPPGEIRGESGTEVRFLHRGQTVRAVVESEIDRLIAGAASASGASAGPFTIRSPLPGVVRKILAPEGTDVAADTPLLTLEAMKMENEIRAGRAGRVEALLVAEGQVVNTGDPLIKIRPL